MRASGARYVAARVHRARAITGLVWYYQALTLDANQQIVATNPTATLFTL